MKNYITLLSFLFMFISGLTADIIQKEYYFNNPEVQVLGEYHLIYFNQTRISGKTGEPGLPYQAVSLLLPPGHTAKKISIVKGHKQTLAGNFNLYPYQPSRPISINSKKHFYKNDNVYQSISPYPSHTNTSMTTQTMNGYSFAFSAFTPIEYTPATGTVSFYQKVNVIIETEFTRKGSIRLDQLSSDPDVIKRVESLAQNPGGISGYAKRAADENDYQLLVITPENYITYFSELRYNYLCQGIKSNIQTTESINSEISGQDLPEKIRNYIIQEYQENGIEHVLLGGDAELVPPRFFYCTALSGETTYETSNIAADLYYSALDGTWNDDGDEYWGEPGEDDLLPEISVARLPFSSNHDLTNMLNKTLSYQTNPVTAELTVSLLAGENLWSDPPTWGGDYLDLLIGTHEDNGYTTTGIPASQEFQHLYERDEYWYRGDLITAINNGIHFLHHSGHSSSSYNMKLNDSDITNANFNSVDGITHNFPVIYTHGCLAGMFGQSDCIAEEMLKLEKFAVAGAFNSHYGWFNEGQTEGPSTHLHREFVDALYHDGLYRIGAAHLESKIQTAPWVNLPDEHEAGAQRWVHYDCNILGDPALPVWTDTPKEITTVYPDSISIGASFTSVTVYNLGEPVENVMCCLIQDSVLLGKALTNVSGVASIELVNVDNTGDAEIFISGGHCPITAYPVVVVESLSIHNHPVLSENTELLGNYPNPFNPETNILFNLKHPQQVQLAVYNLEGQLIKTLINTRLSAGQYKETWNGTDNSGHRAPSGIYFYRLATPEITKTGKALLIR